MKRPKNKERKALKTQGREGRREAQAGWGWAGAGLKLTEQPEQQPQEQPWHCAVLLLVRALPRDRSGRRGHFCLDTMA